MTILGSTKGAAAFVLGELARGQGGKMRVYGEHRYLPGDKVQHSLHLQDANTERTKLADNWGEAMASALGEKIQHAVTGKKQVITLTRDRPATSPDYLVTWGMLLPSARSCARSPWWTAEKNV